VLEQCVFLKAKLLRVVLQDCTGWGRVEKGLYHSRYKNSFQDLADPEKTWKNLTLDCGVMI